MALAALVTLPPVTTDLDQLGDELAALAAHLDAATARFLTLLREFDARGGWEGGRSCAHWLSWRAGLALGAAREHVRVARALGRLPRLSEALGRGEVSYSKVRALTRIATPETEARLLAVAQSGTAAHEEGYRVERATDGTLRFSTPRGWPIPEAPAPPAVPADPSAALVAAHRAQGLAIDGWTACPEWYGERLDLGWAISVLHPAANPGAYRPAGHSP